MNKRFKVMAISAIIALALTLPLVAQTPPPFAPNSDILQGVVDPTSNQRNATASLYKTDVDNYLNVNNWSGVSFDKWFGFLHGIDYSPNFRANLGYATTVGGLYLGTRYWGNIFQQDRTAESVTLNPTYDEDTNALTQLIETTTRPNKYRDSTNHLDILVGVAGQGIRVGFYESMRFNSREGSNPFITTDTQNGYIRYQNETDEYKEYSGYLQPSLQWGTQLKLGDLTIKPRAGAAFNIYMDKLTNNYYGDYTTLNGNLVGSKDLTIGAGRNSGYLQPVFTAGADLGLPKKDTVALTLTLDYLMNFQIFNNDYSVNGIEGTAKGPVSWGRGGSNGITTITTINNTLTTKTTTLDFNDTSRMYHRIAPKFMADKAVTEGLKLGLVIQAPVTITTTSNDRYSEEKTYAELTTFNATNSADATTTTDGTTYTPGGLTESTAVEVRPSVRVGASYNLIPNRFTVNAGIQLDPTRFNYTKSTSSRNGDGVRTTQTITDGDGRVIGKTDETTLGTGISIYPPTGANAYNDASTVTTAWGAFNGMVAGGFLLSFNENVALDFLASASTSGFTTLLYEFNVMLTLKF